MKNKLAGPLSFALAIAVIILALKVMNWVPLAFQTDTVRPYASIEEVRAALHMKNIYVPSYFPQQITWPPAMILAQGKPFSALAMKFTRANRRDTALVISQSEGGALEVGNPIEITTIREQVTYSMQGRDAVLAVGACENGETCSGITWKEGTYTVNVLMKSSPFELTRIAESMIR